MSKSNRNSIDKSIRYKSKILSKIQKLQNELMDMKYRSKINLLLESYEFNFDIQNVITNKKQKIIHNLCYCFFKFIMIRMMLNFYNQNFGQNEINTVQTQKNFGIKAKQLNIKCNNKKQNKNRATTTTTISILNEKKPKRIKTQQKIQALGKQKYERQKDDEQNIGFQIMDRTIKASAQLKQAYFFLTQSYSSRNRIVKIQQICFLISLISADVLHMVIQQLQQCNGSATKIKNSDSKHSKEQQIEESSGISNIEEQIYIVFIFQTLGSLVSPNSFSFLKKKYIKTTIFQGSCDNSYMKLVRSLKHIKDKLTSNKDIILIKSRRQRGAKDGHKTLIPDSQENQFTKQKMKKFIKQILKTKQTINIGRKVHRTVKQEEIQQFNHRFQSTFYASNSQNKLNSKISLSKQNPARKISPSIKIKLNLQNFKENKNRQEVKKKYIANINRTFYKFKSKIEELKQSHKNIKSQRPTYKSVKPISQFMNTQPQQGNGQEYQLMQVMKKKIRKLKVEALKDKQTIDELRNFQKLRTSHRQTDRKLQQQRNKNCQLPYASKTVCWPNSPRQNKAYTQKPNKNKLQLHIDLGDKSQQIGWHNMYNIRAETVLPLKVEKQAKTYKFSKNSDKLRKFQKIFNDGCKKRHEAILGENSNLFHKLKML